MITILLQKILEQVKALKTNIGNINTSIDFSTDEKIIGKWIDGRDLYYRVYTLTQDLSVGSSWVPTGCIIPYADNICMGFINRIGAKCSEAMSVGLKNDSLENAEVQISTPYYTYPVGRGTNIVCFYTKSTDIEEG